jgi:hypothetical protein
MSKHELNDYYQEVVGEYDAAWDQLSEITKGLTGSEIEALNSTTVVMLRKTIQESLTEIRRIQATARI